MSLTISVSAFSQMPGFSQNMFTQLLYNPASAAVNKESSLDLGMRAEIGQFANSSLQYLGNAIVYLPCINSGIGFTNSDFSLGIEGVQLYKLSYSYQLKLGSGTLAAGASIGYSKMSFNGFLPFPGGGVTNVTNFATTYQTGFGLYYLSSGGAYIGISSDKLANGALTSTSQDLKYQTEREYYISAGIPIHTKVGCDIIPSALLESDGSNTQGQMDLRMQSETVWVGCGYRFYPNESMNPATLILLVGVMHEFKNGSGFRIGYSYDFSDYSPTAMGAPSELHLQYYIGHQPKETTN